MENPLKIAHSFTLSSSKLPVFDEFQFSQIDGAYKQKYLKVTDRWRIYTNKIIKMKN
jgi:hypothetical protein